VPREVKVAWCARSARSAPRPAVPSSAVSDVTTQRRPGAADDESPAHRLLAAIELSELAEQMLLHRLRREGASEDEVCARLEAWRSGAGPHAGDPWFAPRLSTPAP